MQPERSAHGLVLAYLADEDDRKPVVTDLRPFTQDRPRSTTGRPYGWASEVGKCERAQSYRIHRVEKTNPVDPKDRVNFWVGDRVQELIQLAAATYLGDRFQCEVSWGWPVDLPYDEAIVHGRADGVVLDKAGAAHEAWEIKKVHTYIWEKATGITKYGRPRKDGAEGPRREDIAQGNLSAYIMGAAKTRVVYMVTDANQGSDRVAEWTYPVDPVAATADLQALANGVRRAEQSNVLTPRIWEGTPIDDPAAMRWPCAYCRWLDDCKTLPTTAIALPQQDAGDGS